MGIFPKWKKGKNGKNRKNGKNGKKEKMEKSVFRTISIFDGISNRGEFSEMEKREAYEGIKINIVFFTGNFIEKCQ